MNKFYKQKDLDLLWNFLENTKCLYHGNYVGLEETKFDLSIKEFEENYKKELNMTWKNVEGKVTKKISEVINEIENKYIIMHHLSCQANTNMFDENTVLCIHYKTEEDKHKAYALPGIRHVPSKKTLEDWIEIKK